MPFNPAVIYALAFLGLVGILLARSENLVRRRVGVAALAGLCLSAFLLSNALWLKGTGSSEARQGKILRDYATWTVRAQLAYREEHGRYTDSWSDLRQIDGRLRQMPQVDDPYAELSAEGDRFAVSIGRAFPNRYRVVRKDFAASRDGERSVRLSCSLRNAFGCWEGHWVPGATYEGYRYYEDPNPSGMVPASRFG